MYFEDVGFIDEVQMLHRIRIKIETMRIWIKVVCNLGWFLEGFREYPFKLGYDLEVVKWLWQIYFGLVNGI